MITSILSVFIDNCSPYLCDFFHYRSIVVILALGNASNVGVRVEYMDRGEAEGASMTTAHDFLDGLKSKEYLLYQPGHYDFLYPN